MSKYRFHAIGSLVAMVCLFVMGCGKQTVLSSPPAVTATNPANGTTGVPIAQVVTATFSVAMNPATVSSSTFKLVGPGGTSVNGLVAYAAIGSIASFTPSVSLAYNSLYTATITTGVTDTLGTQPAANYSWSFTTVTQPTVVSTNPANGATGVLINQILSASFSKALNPATVNGSTFTLAALGGGTVTGSVSYTATGSVASFIPTAPLAYNTQYVATITTGVTDSTGNPMATNYVWSFTTAAQPIVVTTNPVNGATNVPVAQLLTATFSKAMNPATLNIATFKLSGVGIGSVSGTVTYTAAGSIATFTPVTLLQYSTAYTVTITTGATDSTGAPLAANYVWSFTTASRPTIISTTPTNGATGVALNQTLTANFSKPMNCATLATPAGSFNLTGPSTIPVAGTVTCSGSSATFTSNTTLLTNTVYTATVTTAALDSTGNSLPFNYSWSFRTVPAPNAPTVIATTPANGATATPVNQAVSATFSSAMNSATINASTFTLQTGGAAVTGVVTYVAAGSVAIFTPTASLTAGSVYTATVSTGAQDLSGTGLASSYVWSFTTAASPNTTKPTVIATVPLNAATAVPTTQVVSATFSSGMNAGTINSATFLLTGPGATPVAGQVAYSSVGNTATYTPVAALAPNTLFMATITTGATDLSGNALAVNYVWTFTTGASAGSTKPQLVSTTPANSSTGVPLNQVISATFSTAMNPLTISTATFHVTGPGSTPVSGTVSYDAINFIASFTPSAPLTASSIYVANITSGATDLTGNSLANTGAQNPWSFTTGTTITPSGVNLGTAALFGGFGGTAGLTNQGIFTVVNNGNLGTTGVSTIVTGFHDNTPGCVYTETPLNVGLVNGSIYTAAPPPTVACPNEGTAVTAAIAAKAAADALIAYNALVAFPNGLDVSTCPGCGGGSAGELGNRTLAPGIYKAAPGSYAISQGDLTLDAQGNPNAFWVFQMATTLTVGTPSAHRNVLLVNGAQPKNVFWQVGTAATVNGILGGGTMQGTIISQAGISVSTAGVVAVTTINGRLLVLTGPVTMVNTVVNVP